MRMPPRHTPNSLRRCSYPMPKKQFNTTALQNELEQSAFFATPKPHEDRPAPAPAPVQEQQLVPPSVRPDEPTIAPSDETPIDRPFDRTNERTKVRHSFDV